MLENWVGNKLELETKPKLVLGKMEQGLDFATYVTINKKGNAMTLNELKKQREEINSQISKLELDTSDQVMDVLRDEIGDDIADLLLLCGFQQKGVVSVKLDYDCNFRVEPFETVADGNVFVDLKEPKDYHLSGMIGEDFLADSEINEEIETLCPAVAKQFAKKQALEKKIIDKATKVVAVYDKKLSVMDLILDLLAEMS